MGLLQVLLGLLVLFFLSRCTGREENKGNAAQNVASQTDTTKTPTPSIDSTYVPIAGYYSEDVKQKLRDLEKLKFEQITLAGQLLDYLKQGDNDLGVEFKFIDLRFEKRDAVISEKVAHEIPELATILKQFPNMKIKLSAYTDNVGDEKANEKLTESRAMEVRRRLVAEGIDESRIQIKGYGEKFPVGDNKTYDGRLINNRIEMEILSK
jgi:outer membrane protein OmpA-like peptidoglycan-associated protein